MFRTGEDGRPTTVTHDVGGYFDLAPVDRGEGATWPGQCATVPR